MGGRRLGREVLRLSGQPGVGNLSPLLCAQGSTYLSTPLHLPPEVGITLRVAQGLSKPQGGQQSHSLSCLAPFNPPSRTITYSAGEGKGWKSGDLQFLQKRNSLAKCFPVLGL